MGEMIELRDYQQEVVDNVYNSWNAGNRNVLAVLPTGAGKSVIVASILRELTNRRQHCAVIAHRNELVTQMSCHLATAGIMHRVIASAETVSQINRKHYKLFGRSFVNPAELTAVIGVDTLISRFDSMVEWGRQIDFWVVDEVHHLTRGNKWGRALSLFPNARGLGVTATPARADGQGLGCHADGFMDDMIIGPTTRKLIEAGFLADYEIVCPKSDINLDGVETSKNGDWSNQALRKAAKKSKIVGDVVSNYMIYAAGRKAIVFATDVETADEIANDFNLVGVKAVSLNGNSATAFREKSLEDFAEGNVQVLVNVDLFDEGFNCLDTETEILTPNGWKNFEQMKNEKTCYGWNPETNEAVETDVLAYGVRELKENEKMFEIKSQHTDIRVSEGHRFYYKDVNYYKFGTDGLDKNIKIRTGKELYEDPVNKFALPLCAENNFKGIPLSDDEIRLLGWYMSDGYLGKRGGLEISQCKKKYIPQIRKIIENCGLEYRETVSTVKTSYKSGTILHRFSIKRKDISHLLSYMDKKNPPVLLNQMTRNQFKILWGSMMDGNGTAQKNKTGKCVTRYKGQADWVLAQGTLRGFHCMYGTYETKNGVKMYNIGINDKKWIHLYQKDKRGAKFNLYVPAQKEQVWCVSNALKTLITRRNGKITILGNCPACDVIIMARPTMSLGKYLQMIGRGLRPQPGKTALVIDHVSNVLRHGLPDKIRQWSLNRRDKRGKSLKDPDELELTVCKHCLKPYEKFRTVCPYCGFEKPLPDPHARSIEMVEGDLVLLDKATLERLRARTVLEAPADVARRVAFAAGPIAAKGVAKRQIEKISAQSALKEVIATWAAVERSKGFKDQEIYRKFYLTTGLDVLSALGSDRSRQDYEDMTETVKGWYMK